MKDLESETIARVKGFLIFAVFKHPNARVSQHTIAVHQEQLDPGGAQLNV
jgi:hypothetical protein